MDFSAVSTCILPTTSLERDPQQFWGNLTLEQRQEWLRQLRTLYYQIILLYFRDAPDVHERIAQFTYIAYMLNLPISEVLGMHMHFMDEIIKQLKLEGRSEEVVLDYRLTLIDVIAHLCERYRRAMVEVTREAP